MTTRVRIRSTVEKSMIDDPRLDTLLDTIAFAAVDDLLVLCHSRDNPSDAEWDVWIANERKLKHRALVVVTLGGAPNSRQRARVAELLAKKEGATPPVAVLTSSTMNRTLMTAFTWLLGKSHRMRAFAPGAVEEAVSWTGIKVRPERVRAVIARLQASLASPRARSAEP